MKVDIKKGNLSAYRGEAIVVCHFEDSRKLQAAALQLDSSSGGVWRGAQNRGLHRKARTGLRDLHAGALPVRRIVLLGLGKRKDFDPEKLRRPSRRRPDNPRAGHPAFAASLASLTGPAVWKT